MTEDKSMTTKIRIVQKHLAPEKLRSFDAMSQLQKEHYVFGLINKGVEI